MGDMIEFKWLLVVVLLMLDLIYIYIYIFCNMKNDSPYPHLMGDDWYARGVLGGLMRVLDSIPEVQDGIKGGLLYGHWPNSDGP